MSQAFDVAVLGATGLVGQTMIELLEERDFPVNRLYPLDVQLVVPYRLKAKTLKC